MQGNTVITLRGLWLKDVKEFWEAFLKLNEEDCYKVVLSIWISVVYGQPGFREADFQLISELARDYLPD